LLVVLSQVAPRDYGALQRGARRALSPLHLEVEPVESGIDQLGEGAGVGDSAFDFDGGAQEFALSLLAVAWTQFPVPLVGEADAVPEFAEQGVGLEMRHIDDNAPARF
jgi:hypothetical protein